jgi:GxxExxY protein
MSTDKHRFTGIKMDKNGDNNKLLEAELSYKIRGCFYRVFNQYGPGLKEIVYHKALAEELQNQGVNFVSNPRINIFSQETGKILGTYIPDFIVENKIIIEIKALNRLTFLEKNQLMSYLRASLYEIAFLVNFGASKLEINRLILTNDRKPFIRVNPSSIRENPYKIRVNPCFTLMELLIIITLIAILATAVLVLFNPKKQIEKAWDTKRKNDLNTLRKVLEDYYNDKGCYPTGNIICYNNPKENKKGVGVGATIVGYSCNICGTEPTSPNFSPYLSVLPCDPQHPTKDYLYQYDPSSCPQWFRIYSMFSIRDDSDSKFLGCPYGGCGLKYPPAPTPQYGYDYGVSNTVLESSNLYNCIDQTNTCNTCNTYDQCIIDPGCKDKNKIYGSRGWCCAANPGACR